MNKPSIPPDSLSPQEPSTQKGKPTSESPSTEVSETEHALSNHRNIASFARALLPKLYETRSRSPAGPVPKAEMERIERAFRPWPKWVLRLAAEVAHASNPTIPKHQLFQALRVFHACLFRRSIDTAIQCAPSSSIRSTDQLDQSVLDVLHASFLGHSYEHIEAARKELDARLARGEITSTEHAEQQQRLSINTIQEALRSTFESWSKSEVFQLPDLIHAFENARQNTFDKHGSLKESPLLPVYRVMLSNWITIENMTGPKELANFLSPQLKGKSKSATGEIARIATLCSRLGVRFRGCVKNY